MKLRRTTMLIFLLVSISSHVFAVNDYIPGMTRLNLGNFFIYSGRAPDRERMIASGYNLPGFTPYNGEQLKNAVNGDNYHVFKTTFTISGGLTDKDLTLYINRFDMPVIIQINGNVILRKGLRLETDGAYSTGELAALDIPLTKGIIGYYKENTLIIEVFPECEISALPELSIAEYKDNAVKIFIKNLFDIYLVLAAQFIALLVAIYHFSAFISRGCKDSKYLIFSFLSLSFVLAYSNIGFSFDSHHYLLLTKLTRCFQMLCLGFYSMFITETSELFAKQKKFILSGIVLYSAVCAVYIFIQGNKADINAVFSMLTNFYLTPALLFCIIVPVISIIVKKNYGIIPLLIATLIVVAASLRDLLLLSGSIQPLFWYGPYSYLFLVMVIYGVLVHEESSLFKNFKRYVPADLVIKLINRNITADLGGEHQELTVFFSDIAKFTSIVEKMEPENLIQDLCVYFEKVSKTILENNGTIDKYIGDAVMAFWGAPIPLEDHAKKACHAAISIRDKLNDLFSQWNIQGKEPFLTRIGIHTGNVIVGNLGYKDRLNYTVVGDTVNVSSRLEGINKIYGTEIAVSENTYQKCKDDFEFRLLDNVSLLGRHKGTHIYELIAEKNNIDEKTRKLYRYYEAGLKFYFEQNWIEALKYFNTVLKHIPADKPSSLMRDRCLLYRKNPPPENWNGIFVQTVK